jgi:uncharacterized RmlC-like cupin family protein
VRYSRVLRCRVRETAAARVAERASRVEGSAVVADQQWNRLYFDEWVAREGLDLIRGWKVDDVYSVPLKPWARTEGLAVQIQLEGTGELNAAYVQEIPPGRHLAPQRHLFEELVYVLTGRGSTSVWYSEDRKSSFEWKAGSLFALPLNAYYQFFNGSGVEPARYVAVTTAPSMLNLVRNDDFIFNNPARFPERFDSESDYFAGEVNRHPFYGFDIPRNIAFGNFFADIDGLPYDESNRGVGTRGVQFEIGNGVLGAHNALFPGGTFTKVHRHGPGAHVIWLRGEGYTLMWPEGGERLKEEWRPGTMLVPPSWWWHQHCVVSANEAQHLALKLNSRRNKVNRLGISTMKSTRQGGGQMNFEDFPPGLMEEVMRLFRVECEKRGTPVHMEPVYEG